ncbi:MAG: family 2 glycosyl transferase [Eubacteriales bacterium]|nr:family 2 glycosyl transferase [Eubacteriales bacterium]
MQKERSRYRSNRLMLSTILFCGILLFSACAPRADAAASSPALAPDTAASAQAAEPTPVPTPSYRGPVSRVDGKRFLVRNSDGIFEPLFIKGVDIGAAKPGYWPGEFGITQDDYLRWFQLIGAMNANTIRVYVSQMPAFYNALLAYNESAKQPLYLLQGVYMNEEMIASQMDAYGGGGALIQSFYRDLKNAVDIVHGNAVIEKLPGNAGGTYTSDVSNYVIGYLPGIEFSADFVLGTNEKNPDKTSFSGTYVETENASPFEVFLAESQEYLIGYEVERYGVQRPVAVTNWVTTDPLTHSNEPYQDMEDAVSIDVEHMKATPAYTAGFFASYHVYPYYPDLMSYEPKYIGGEPPNPYRAYLTELNAYHTMPVLISEFGIPTSRGKTHENAVTGFNQGHVEETAQGEMLVSMMNDILDTGCMGGLIFSWQDEWFKRTWNTTEQEDVERRPYWFSVESPEKTFGLLSFDPGETTAVRIDGKAEEWSKSDVITDSNGMRLSVKSDEAYLYFLVDTGSLSFGTDPIYIAADTIANQGNFTCEGIPLANAADFLIVLNGEANSSMLVDPYYDVFQFQYSVQNKMLEPLEHQSEKNSGDFTEIYAAMSRGIVLPETGEVIPFSKFDAGRLTYGISDPNSANYNSLADFYAGSGVVELRIPWLLFNVRDPGTKNIIADWNATGTISGQNVESFSFAVFPSTAAGTVPFGTYSWESWDLPTYHERLKKSYPMIQQCFAEIG